MKKFILMICLVFWITACGNSVAQDLQTVNRLVSLNEENFSSEVSNLVTEVTKYNSEIGDFLSQCDVGVTRDVGFDLLQEKKIPNCLIIFIPNSLTHKEMLKEFAPPGDPDDLFTVAMVKDVVGSDYPLIFIGEKEFDFFYLTRVLAHEGFHAINVKNKTECLYSPVCEEANAYRIQFEILKNQYPNYSGIDSVVLPGTGVINYRALEMELFLYDSFLKENLEKELLLMGYGFGE